MFGNVARMALATIPAALLTLAGCGPSREDELERQLAEAKAEAQKEASARAQAQQESAAARRQARDAELAKFYQGGDDTQQAEEPQASSASAADVDAPPPPAGMQADGRPIGDEMPAPR